MARRSLGFAAGLCCAQHPARPEPGAVPSSPDLWPCKAKSIIPTLGKKNTSCSGRLAFARAAQGPFGVSLWLFYVL